MKVLQSGRAKAFIFLAIGIVGGSLAAGPLPPALAQAFQGQHGVQPHIVYTGNSNQPTLKAINNGTGAAILGQAVSSAGIFGQSVSGGGIVGLSTSGYGLTGTSSTNIGLNGTSTSNNGISGATHVAYPKAGVVGFSLASSGSPVGVYGQTGATGAGVVGDCLTGTVEPGCIGVVAQVLDTNGIALDGFSFATSSSDPVLSLDSVGGSPIANFTGLGGLTGTMLSSGELSIGPPLGGQALNVSGTGFVAQSTDANGSPNSSDVGFFTNSTGFGLASEHHGTASFPALYLSTDGNESSGSLIINVQNFNSGAGMTLDNNGNETLSGHITTAGGTLDRVREPSGGTVDTYGARQTVPTIEDFGQGQIVNGQGYVQIDAAFGSTVDFRRPYLVFLTPDGDTNGLYIAGKTSQGFTVRETRGGRSTIAFDYRIVAKPIDENGARLPAAANVPRQFGPSGRPVDARTQLRRMNVHLPRGGPLGITHPPSLINP